MSTETYSSNILAHRNPVMNFPSTITVTENTTILVRLAPDEVRLDIPFNRVTTWNRLIQTLFEIYMRNNPSSRHLSVGDALDSVQITNDLTGGIILPELWPDFIKPHVKIAAIFNEPFKSPPWFPELDTNVKQEEDDIDMMDGVVSYAIEPKLGGFVEPVDWRKQPYRLIGPPPLSKLDNFEQYSLLPTPISALPASPFTFSPSYTNTWTPLEAEKPRIRTNANMNPTALVSEVYADSVAVPRSVSQDPMTDAMRESASPPPPIYFRNSFPNMSLSGSSPLSATAAAHRLTPVRQGTSSETSSRAPTHSPECSSRPGRGGDTRPAKRKRDDDAKMGSSPMEACMEPPRKSRSPFPSESNGKSSRSQSVEAETNGSSIRRLVNPAPKARKSDPKTIVLHQKLLLLDSINAGEMVKIVKTKDGDLIVIRDDEEPEEFIERRRSSAGLIPLPIGKDKKELDAKNVKKRTLEAAEELRQIWSGFNPEPPAKRPRAKAYEKLTLDHKHKIAKFVHEQHIIRIDHFTNPVIQEWKTRTIPEADSKQTEEYLEEVATNKYSDSTKRKEAYRIFMEHHNHCHKSTDSPAASQA